MLELLRVDMNVPVNYILTHKLYKPIVRRIVGFSWDYSNEKLLFSAIKLGSLMIESNSGLRHKLKKLGFLKVFLVALDILTDRRLLYDFAFMFIKHNTLSVMQLAYKHQLFQNARDNAQDDSFAEKFIKESISHYGRISTLLVNRQMLHGTPKTEILEMIIDIPIHFKIREPAKVISLLSEVEKSLDKLKREPEKKLEIVKFIVITVIELIFYWPWLKFAHVHGLCTSHPASQFMSFCKNPLMFHCNDCGQILCMPCASLHPFKNLEFCGYRSDATKCSKATSCSLIERPTTMTSLAFLTNIDLMRIHRLKENDRLLSEEPGKHCFEIKLGNDGGSVLLEGQDPLFSEEDMADQVKTLAYFEVEVKSGGINDAIGIGFSGFEYRGDTGLVKIDGQAVGVGPMYGSYDIVGVGITAKEVYLTYNGLLLRPFYSHPFESDYRLKINLQGSETSVSVRLNISSSTSWLFKPPFNSSIDNEIFTPEPPYFIDEGFIKSMKKRLNDCSQYRRVPELAETLTDIKFKAEAVLSFDYKRLMRLNTTRGTEQNAERRRRKRSPEICVLY